MNYRQSKTAKYYLEEVKLLLATGGLTRELKGCEEVTRCGPRDKLFLAGTETEVCFQRRPQRNYGRDHKTLKMAFCLRLLHTMPSWRAVMRRSLVADVKGKEPSSLKITLVQIILSRFSTLLLSLSWLSLWLGQNWVHEKSYKLGCGQTSVENLIVTLVIEMYWRFFLFIVS